MRHAHQKKRKKKETQKREKTRNYSGKVTNGIIKDLDSAKDAVFEREKAISTGMQYGVAIPHGRIAEVEQLHVAVGFAPEGIDFGALDGQPSQVFVLTVVPTKIQVPYVQFLAAISSAMSSAEKVKDLMALTYRKEVIEFFSPKKD